MASASGQLPRRIVKVGNHEGRLLAGVGRVIAKQTS